MKNREYLENLTKNLNDKGKLIEAGFVGLRLSVMSPDAPHIQVEEMRLAFMAGAQHLFASIMTILDPGDEPTDDDIRRMGLISKELEAFAAEMEAKIKTKGRV